MWIYVDTCGYMGIHVDTWGYMGIHVDTCGYMQWRREGGGGGGAGGILPWGLGQLWGPGPSWIVLCALIGSQWGIQGGGVQG